MSAGQVLADVNPEDPEAADSLHRSPIDGEGGMSSLSLPVVHNQLLCFADVGMEVVVLATRCQGSDLLSAVSSSPVIRPMVAVSSANLMMVLKLWVATQLNGECGTGLVLRVRVAHPGLGWCQRVVECTPL